MTGRAIAHFSRNIDFETARVIRRRALADTGGLILHLYPAGIANGFADTECAAKGLKTLIEAIHSGTPAVSMPKGGNRHESGSQTGSDSICNINAFKKNPGVADLSLLTTSRNSVPGATLTLRNASSAVVGTAISDLDGFYQINYKHTGRAANYIVKCVRGTWTQTKTVSLKANASFQVDFGVPSN